MEGKEEDVKLGANKYAERQPIGTSAQTKDYKEPPAAPLFEPGELKSWSFYRAGIAEFIATFLFLYITLLTVMGLKRAPNMCASVGIQGIAWAFGGTIFALVYSTAGISGGHINPAVTFGLLLARKLSLTRAVFYMIMQCLGAICGAGVVKGFQPSPYEVLGGGANVVAPGYTKGSGLGAEIVGTFVLVYTVFSATDAKRSARDSHVPILAPLPIGFAVFLVHLATIPITGTGINPARSLGAAIIFNREHAWNDHSYNKISPKCSKNPFDGPKKEAIKEIGFGGLLDLNTTSIPRKLILHLVKCFDLAMRTISVSQDSSYVLNKNDVADVFGLPAGPSRVPILTVGSNIPKNDIVERWRKEFNGEKQISLAALKKRLTDYKNKKPHNNFKRMFVVFSMASFLAPTSNSTIELSLLKAVEDVSQIKNLDWCEYVLSNLLSALTPTYPKYLLGCVLFLLLSYFYKFDHPKYPMSREVPLIKHWDDDTLSNRVADEIGVYLFLQWIFWVGPFIGAALAAMYHQIVIRAIPFKSGSRSTI